MKIKRDWVTARKANQLSQNNNRKLVYSKKSLRHKPSRKPSSLVYSLFPNDNSLTFFLISVKMDLENKVIGFQFEPERSISNHKGFFQDSSDEGDAMEQDIFDRKDCDSRVRCKCRNWNPNRKGMAVLSQWKQKRNACAIKKWRRFAILFFREYLSWVKQ